MAGWNLKNGLITNYYPDDDLIWSLFNRVFSDSSPKRNTYKFGFIKSLLDNAFNGIEVREGWFYTYTQLFARFAENYWNLVVKYNLRQMRPDGKSFVSKIESILKEAAGAESILSFLEFSAITESNRLGIIQKVSDECRKYVVGALYSDFNGIIYSFDLKGSGLTLNRCVHEFMLKYKFELEKLNYYAWAKFLERINNDNLIVRVLDKLDSATPRRNDLSLYREILKKASCNVKKNNRLPTIESLERIQLRNSIIMNSDNQIIKNDFEAYYPDLLDKMWHYAKLSGLREISEGRCHL